MKYLINEKGDDPIGPFKTEELPEAFEEIDDHVVDCLECAGHSREAIENDPRVHQLSETIDASGDMPQLDDVIDVIACFNAIAVQEKRMVELEYRLADY